MGIGHSIKIADLDKLDTQGKDRAEWLDMRRSGIGGSDVGKIAGLSAWGSPLSVYNSKVNDTDGTVGPAAWMGHRLEPIVADMYEAETGQAVNEPRALVRHPEHDFMLANIDRVQTNDRLLEIKCRRNPWSDGVPLDIEFQCRHYLAVTGFEGCDLAVLFGGVELEVFNIERDLEVEAALVDLERQFWVDHVGELCPPPPIGFDSGQLGSTYVGDPDARAEADENIVRLVAEKAELAARAAAIKSQLDDVDASIKAFMADATQLWCGSVKLATWSASKTKKSIDVKALTDAHPSIVAEFTTEVDSARRLALSPAGKKLYNNGGRK